MEIAVWSDFTCPWCALGLARLEVARAQFAHADALTVRHRAFELDRRAPARRPESMEEVVVRRYGISREQARAGQAQLRRLGEEVGLELAFERVQLGSTFDAHRLTLAAAATEATAATGEPGRADALVRRLFRAYFTEGALLSDHATLRRLAADAGLPRELVEQVLESDAQGDEVRADEADARERGITGVPHFLVNGAWAVPGAQDVDTLLAVLNRAWTRADVESRRP